MSVSVPVRATSGFGLNGHLYLPSIRYVEMT
jgi:hypothetical protein